MTNQRLTEDQYNRQIFRAVLLKQYDRANALTKECNGLYGKAKKAQPAKDSHER